MKKVFGGIIVLTLMALPMTAWAEEMSEKAAHAQHAAERQAKMSKMQAEKEAHAAKMKADREARGDSPGLRNGLW